MSFLLPSPDRAGEGELFAGWNYGVDRYLGRIGIGGSVIIGNGKSSCVCAIFSIYMGSCYCDLCGICSTSLQKSFYISVYHGNLAC